MSIAQSNIPVILLLVVILVVGIAFVQAEAPKVSVNFVDVEVDEAETYFTSHAVEKHPKDAPAVRECIKSKGVHSLWQENNGNYIQLCQVDTDMWGMRICKTSSCAEEDEITAFIKNKMSRLDQVIKYLANHGARLVK